jgi:hypothetical protein
MKRLVFGICLIFLIMTAHSQTPLWCLNGYTRDQAIIMVQAFNNQQKTSTTAPVATSIWFDMHTVKKIKILLESEMGRVNHPSGIRIYFGYDSDRGQNTVILVSTYATIVKGDVVQKDYFDHISTFVPSNKGDISNVADGTDGALLHIPCQTIGPPPACPCLCLDDVNYQPGQYNITHKYGQEMVAHFGLTPQINSRAEWFPLYLIKNLYDTTYSGVRVYFAKRTKDEIDSRYKERDAFVIEHTQTRNVNGGDVEQDSFKGGTAPALLPVPKKVMPEGLYTALISQIRSKLLGMEKSTITDQQIRAYIDTTGVDEGELCPDHCDTSSPLYTTF